MRRRSFARRRSASGRGFPRRRVFRGRRAGSALRRRVAPMRIGYRV